MPAGVAAETEAAQASRCHAGAAMTEETVAGEGSAGRQQFEAHRRAGEDVGGGQGQRQRRVCWAKAASAG